MPSGKSHIKIGSIVAIIYLTLYWYFFKLFPIKWYLILLCIPITYVMSLVPDLDSYFGKLRTLTLKIIFFILCFSLIIPILIKSTWLFFLILTTVGLLGTALMMTKHRGPLHNPIFIIVCSLLTLFIHWFFLPFAIVVGMSHLISDKIVSKIRKDLKIKDETPENALTSSHYVRVDHHHYFHRQEDKEWKN